MTSVAPALFFGSLLAGAAAGGLWWPAPYEIADLASRSESAETWAIAANNLTLALALFVLSAATIGLGTIVALFINGLIIGQLSVLLIGNGLGGMLLVGLLPHALIEAAGLCLIGSAGLLAPLVAARLIVHSSGRSLIHSLLVRAAVLIVGGVALIIVAAAIEDHISTVAW